MTGRWYQGMSGARWAQGPAALRAAVAAAVLPLTLFALAVFGGPPAHAAADDFPVATDMRIGGDDHQTRIVVDLSRKIDVAAFTLADPYRVVVDLPQINFRLSAEAARTSRGLVKAARYGLIMQGGSRMVFDVKSPVRVERAFSLAAADGQPARLVVDLVATDRDSFMRRLSVDNRAQRTPTVRSLPAVDPADPRPLIVIDPGHGGIDTGAQAAGGADEKVLVLAFGHELRKAIEKTGKYRVAMTRNDDTFIPLQERVQIARQLKASLFISIHADFLPRSEGAAQGATVYTLSDRASDAEAARLAELENKADVIAGVDLTSEPSDIADILIDLAQRETKSFSAQFARAVVGELKSVTKLHLTPLKSAGFIVLKAPDVPSVLVELGYVSTPSDLAQLQSQEWRARTAQAMARAVDAFFVPLVAGNRPAGTAR